MRSVRVKASSSSSSSKAGAKGVRKSDDDDDAQVLERLSTMYAASTAIAGTGFVVQTGAAAEVATRVFDVAADAAVPALVQVSQIRNDVSFLPLVCAMAWSMKQASDKGNLLSSSTYTSLNIGAFIYAALGLGTAAAYGGFSGDASLLGLIKLATLLPVGVSCAFALAAQANSSNGNAVADAVATVGKDLRTSFFDVRRESKLSTYFIAQLWITVVVGGSFLLSPTSPVANPPELGGETATLALIRHCFGTNALFSLCPALFVLQSAAERDRLGASTFRNLAVGSGIATFLVTLYTLQVVVGASGGASGQVTDYSLLPNLVSALLISSAQSIFYIYVGVRK